MEEELIRVLIHKVEERLNAPLRKPKDFEFLLKMLPKEDVLSISTLKRVWQYVPNEHIPRETTLNILARFVGYMNYKDFVYCYKEECDSGFIKAIDVSKDLDIGDKLELTWKQNRLCKILKTTDGNLQVIESINCKLQVGDTFRTSLITEGHPLIVTHLTRNGLPLPDYIAGKKYGLTSVKRIAQDKGLKCP